MKKVSYTCNSCGYKYRLPYAGWYPHIPCLKCGKTAKMDILSGNNMFVKKYSDVTALVFDKKTGQPLWLGKNGKKLRHDDPSVRYDLIKDPRGWRAVGKKVREGADQ